MNQKSVTSDGKRIKKLRGRIRNQMEFYFSDSNLAKDRLLTELISKDPEGYVDIEFFKSFNKIKELIEDLKGDTCQLIADAVRKSNIFKVSADCKRLKRTTPIELKDFDACTLYVEKLPLHADQKWVQDVFRNFGAVKHVNVPRYKVTRKIKGFAFVEFENADDVKKACEYYKILPEKDCPMSEDESKNLKTVAKKHKNDEMNEKKSKKSGTRSVSESSDQTDFTSLKHDQSTEALEKDSDYDLTHLQSKRKRKRADSASDFSTKKSKESVDENVKSSISKSDEKVKVELSKMKTEDIKVESKEHEVIVNDKQQNVKDTNISKAEEMEIKTDNEPGKDKVKIKEQPSEKAEKHEEESMEIATEIKQEQHSKENGIEVKKKKKKRKKKKKHSNVEPPSLRVMPKSEWKMYRNKYLDLQRSTMKFLKEQVMLEYQELREQETFVKAMDISEPKKSAQFIPDVIIKITTSNPVKNSSEVKDLIKANAVVAYIDAPVESSEVYVRCHNSDEALAIVKEETLSQLGKAELLTGEEEKNYWEKIEMDKKIKYSNPVPHKKRGRDKLLAKAAKLEEMKNKHIYFED